MHRVTQDIGDTFGPVETALRNMFILSLLQGVGEGTLGRGFACLPVKQAGLALTDPTKTGPKNWTASCVITGYLVAELRFQEEFRMADHSAYMREGK